MNDSASFQINNSDDETKFIVYGDGQVDIANNLDISIPTFYRCVDVNS